MPTPITLPYTIPRHAEAQVNIALDDTRIVALVGPRQSGKTTLVRQIAKDRGMDYITLDEDQSRTFASDDPGGFLRILDRAVIDEIQRSPDLILALKKTVDEDPRPGRFLITGSVDLFASSVSPDSLAGRVETVELLPFSQSEIAQCGPNAFLDRAFTADFPALEETVRTPDLIERVLAGGYPETLVRMDESRQQSWLCSYAAALATRDVTDLQNILKTNELSHLLKLSAATSGTLVNLSTHAASLGVSSKTVGHWLTLLEQMFVLRRIRAWHHNDQKRLVRSPKLHFLDSGLLSALRDIGTEDIGQDRSRFGILLECFVFSELAKLAATSSKNLQISHYRDKDGAEVDFVLERAGQVVGIEVKASASVKSDDFSGLKRLKRAVGEAFACGIILHDSERIQRAGESLFAMPVGTLWA